MRHATNLLEILQPFIHCPPQSRPLRELVLRARLLQLLLLREQFRL